MNTTGTSNNKKQLESFQTNKQVCPQMSNSACTVQIVNEQGLMIMINTLFPEVFMYTCTDICLCSKNVGVLLGLLWSQDILVLAFCLAALVSPVLWRNSFYRDQASYQHGGSWIQGAAQTEVPLVAQNQRFYHCCPVSQGNRYWQAVFNCNV